MKCYDVARAQMLRVAMTDAELRLWRLLRGRQLSAFKFRRQHPIAGYYADFACVASMLVVELDGAQHLSQIAYDARRTAVMQRLGWRVIRFTDTQALTETEAVLESILACLEADRGAPHPRPSPRSRGARGERRR